MSVANLVFHLSVLGAIAVPAVAPLYAQLALVIMVICVMTGRVVPMFTKNVTPGLVIDVSRRFEFTLLAITAATLALWVLGAPAPVVSACWPPWLPFFMPCGCGSGTLG